MPPDQLLGAFLEFPGRLARRIPHDAAVWRIGRRTCDAGDRERLRIGEAHVAVALGHVCRAIGDGSVQMLRARCPPGKAEYPQPRPSTHAAPGWLVANAAILC